MNSPGRLTRCFVRLGHGLPKPGTIPWQNSNVDVERNAKLSARNMSVGVLDAGVVLGWIRGGHRSGGKLESLFGRSRQKKARLVISTVNLAEVLIHTWQWSRSTGGDALTLLRAFGVEIHSPDEAVARRVAKLRTSL